MRAGWTSIAWTAREGRKRSRTDLPGGQRDSDLRWTSIGIWALGESGLYIVSGDGALSGSYDYGGATKGLSLDGDGTGSLLLGKYRAGSIYGAAHHKRFR